MEERKNRVWMMSTYAQELIGDARILEAPKGPDGFMSDFPTGSLTGFHLLYTFALEVLLKAARLWNDGDRPGGHASADMWDALKANAREEVMAYAEEYACQNQIHLHYGLTNPGKLFDDWGIVPDLCY